MCQQTDTPFLPRDIHNLYAQFKREGLQGLAVTDALIKHLKRNNIQFTSAIRLGWLFANLASEPSESLRTDGYPMSTYFR
jgi:hypothetical protein